MSGRRSTDLLTCRVIPSIFRTEREKEAGDEGVRAEAVCLGQKEGPFVLGFAGAYGTFGGRLIP
jgi:hypothetical protein